MPWRGSDGGDRTMELGGVKKEEEQRSITAIASDKTLGNVPVGLSKPSTSQQNNSTCHLPLHKLYRKL